MFTIKHIDESGREFAMACASYSVEPLEPVRCSSEQRIAVKAYDTPYMQDEYSMLWVGERTSRRPDSSELHIMNRYGATVASHYFRRDGEKSGTGG